MSASRRQSFLSFPILIALAACGGSSLGPAPFDAAHQPCHTCRMVGSDGRFAAEVVAPGEEPIFFDDIVCLRRYLHEGRGLPAGAKVYVADHRTRAWVLAADAVYSRVETIETPMNGHLVAHESAASRDADTVSHAVVSTTVADAFGGASIPRGEQ